MATEANTATAEQTAAAKAKDVLNDMEARRIAPNPTDAIAYLAKCQADFADFGNYPIAAPGITQDENGGLVFDPAVYSDSTNVMVAKLAERGEGANSSRVKAIVIAPIPTLDAVMADQAGKDWLTKIMQKELNHVAVRNLRKAEDNDQIAEAVESMPKTLTEYISSNREGGGLIAVYEELWRPIKNSMAKLSKPWRLANLSKKEMRRAMESKSYASEYYPTLEETKQGSLFEFALKGMIQQAPKLGHDATLLQRWLDNRNEKTIEASDDEEELTLEGLATSFAEAVKSDESPATTVENTPPAEGTPAPAPAPAPESAPAA
jgi:hypothetical protein